jgi:hypothetical protein
MASRKNDRAVAHVEQLLAGTAGTSPSRIWLGTPAYPNSRGESRDEASHEAGHQQEETTDILNGSKKADIAQGQGIRPIQHLGKVISSLEKNNDNQSAAEQHIRRVIFDESAEVNTNRPNEGTNSTRFVLLVPKLRVLQNSIPKHTRSLLVASFSDTAALTSGSTRQY